MLTETDIAVELRIVEALARRREFEPFATTRAKISELPASCRVEAWRRHARAWERDAGGTPRWQVGFVLDAATMGGVAPERRRAIVRSRSFVPLANLFTGIFYASDLTTFVEALLNEYERGRPDVRRGA